MRRMLIIGFGNTLCGDDGVGIVAAEKLDEIVKDMQVQILACQQLTPELAKDISDADRVIMIDADQGEPPGNVTVTRITAREDALNKSSFTHEMSPIALLAFSRKLYGKCPDAFLITVTGESFDFGEGLSRSTTAALPEILRQSIELISQ